MRTIAMRPAAVLLAAALLLGTGGCFNPFAPRIAPVNSVSVPPPEPTSAIKVVQLFAWCWNNRDINTYSQIFTADFKFYFAQNDSAGNVFRDPWVDREEELNIARHLFVGGGSEPPATSVVLNFDPTLRALPDSRPGKDATWHNEIVTNVDLTIKTDEQDYRITGMARFFAFRGDSALIPSELPFKPDKNRWYIDQWNDETLSGAPAPQAAVRPAGATEATIAVAGHAPLRLAIRSITRIPHAPGAAPQAITLDELPISMGTLFAIYR